MWSKEEPIVGISRYQQVILMPPPILTIQKGEGRAVVTAVHAVYVTGDVMVQMIQSGYLSAITVERSCIGMDERLGVF